MDIDARILNYFVENNLISGEIADQIRISSINSSVPVIDTLLSKRIVSEDDILKAKSSIYHIRSVALEGRGISPEILTFIPEPVARKYVLIPFDLNKVTSELSVAMVDPMDLPLLDFLEQKSGKKILAFLGKKTEIIQKIDEEYSQGLSVEVSEAIKETA